MRIQPPPPPQGATLLPACTHPGTSRRFGFAKFADRSAADAALEALRGTLLHGALDLYTFSWQWVLGRRSGEALRDGPRL